MSTKPAFAIEQATNLLLAVRAARRTPRAC